MECKSKWYIWKAVSLQSTYVKKTIYESCKLNTKIINTTQKQLTQILFTDVQYTTSICKQASKRIKNYVIIIINLLFFILFDANTACKVEANKENSMVLITTKKLKLRLCSLLQFCHSTYVYRILIC